VTSKSAVEGQERACRRHARSPRTAEHINVCCAAVIGHRCTPRRLVVAVVHRQPPPQMPTFACAVSKFTPPSAGASLVCRASNVVPPAANTAPVRLHRYTTARTMARRRQRRLLLTPRHQTPFSCSSQYCSASRRTIRLRTNHGVGGWRQASPLRHCTTVPRRAAPAAAQRCAGAPNRAHTKAATTVVTMSCVGIMSSAAAADAREAREDEWRGQCPVGLKRYGRGFAIPVLVCVREGAAPEHAPQVAATTPTAPARTRPDSCAFAARTTTQEMRYRPDVLRPPRMPLSLEKCPRRRESDLPFARRT
jgi:hypothetical protein